MAMNGGVPMNDPSPGAPMVSVITAAYNRSNVLRYAIESLLANTFSDWELLAVDDASTDDTRKLVTSFNDPRIRLIALPRNTGEQSGPNNQGFCAARGRYIAYLNQDDLWFPDHLDKAVAELERTGAAWVFTLSLTVLPSGQSTIEGLLPGGRYHPRYGKHVPATLWVLRREVLEEIGEWRSYRRLHLSPSQDLLRRGWRAGKDIRMVRALTAILVPSGSRPGVYAERQWQENAELRRRMIEEPGLRERLLLDALLTLGARVARDTADPGFAFRNLLVSLARRTAALLGMHPLAVEALRRGLRRGSLVESLRRTRGLPPGRRPES